MATAEHPRLILNNFLSLDLCKELEFIHKSCSTVGYRDNVFSTTLSHLIATNSAQFLIPFVPIRALDYFLTCERMIERLREKAEEFFGCEYELFIEFTGLISWCKGSKIGWHSDDNRSYLKQRDFAAVCYLNNYEGDFKGGLFHFQDGEPKTIVPMAGNVIMYTADSRNVHSVDEIIDGERLTLTLWFSRDGSYNEDAKLISLLSQSVSHNLSYKSSSCVPLPASSSMYWFSLTSPQVFGWQSEFDIRCARLHVDGFDIHSTDYLKSDFPPCDSSFDFSELLMKPLQIVRRDELFDKNFVNILHALQVVQFYCWKASEIQTSEIEMETNSIVKLSQSERECIIELKSVLLKDQQLAETMFSSMSCERARDNSFDWAV